MAKKVLTVEQAEIKAMKKEQSSSGWMSFLAILLAVALVFAAFINGKTMGEEKNAVKEPAYITDDTAAPSGGNNVDQPDNNNTPEAPTNDNQQSQNQPQETVDKDEVSDNPAEWSKEQIVYMYKQAATKTHDTAESSQTMTMPVLDVEGGALGFFLSIAKPAINAVLEKQTTTYGGITGGYQKLVASDVDTAKAYKEGNYTVIEMRMVEQTDGLYGDAQAGTVGHAINVLGNVATAVEQFPAFDIKYEEADIKIHYADPIVKVRINENGMIEKGTWSYMSKIDIKHLAIGSVMVDKAYAEIEYVIVVGGGF
ncbi:MAG: hypothetical protein J6Q50_00670 [Clostridia bacterium]|nr:hypothetical protein [Clostridia bacterium]